MRAAARLGLEVETTDDPEWLRKTLDTTSRVGGLAEPKTPQVAWTPMNLTIVLDPNAKQEPPAPRRSALPMVSVVDDVPQPQALPPPPPILAEELGVVVEQTAQIADVLQVEPEPESAAEPTPPKLKRRRRSAPAKPALCAAGAELDAAPNLSLVGDE